MALRLPRLPLSRTRAARRGPAPAAVWVLCSSLAACGGGVSAPSEPEPRDPTPRGGGSPYEPGPSSSTPAGPSTSPSTTPPTPDDTARPLPGDLPHGSAEDEAQFALLQADMARLRGITAAQLRDEYPLAQTAELGYVPGDAEFMDRIQASALALNAAELAALDEHGFVVSKRQQFPSFLRGYAAIYMEHLPVFVSADALLDAIHRSYDDILLSIESSILSPELSDLLRLMLSRVDGVTASEQTKNDLRLYLQVAAELLQPSSVAGLSSEAQALVSKARAASGIEKVPLFGVPRLFDFSQFTPRGHYTEGLETYFQAMMWLGRVDFRLIETLTDGSTVFRRGQYDAVLALHQLMDGQANTLWSHIDGAVRAFVGESDSMTVPEIQSLVDDLGGLLAAGAASDTAVTEAVRDGGYGKQQIASHLMVNDDTVKTLPLNRSFLLFGQRYVADSHVFSEAVYDRIAKRMLPNPLDAAFAALGNNQALRLDADVDSFPELPGALGSMRRLIDSHPQSFWDANLYNLWSSALRALSPAPDLTAPAELGLPSIAGTEAWGRRLLNTQLGSWAQLRHDTLLYAKQSYSHIPGCEFPDAYIEPYPEFFSALVRYAERGNEIAAIAATHEFLGPIISKYFDTLRSTAALLGRMAENQRSGAPHSAADLAFVNDAIRVEEQSVVCTTVEVPDGWYAQLFFDPAGSIEQDPTIADVHTQPADEFGNIVGRVLHVGTGLPRLMTITVDTCVGPRAYTGMAYAYHEQITNDSERLSDETWTGQLFSEPPPAEVPWMQGLVAE